ncbi:MAG TPA: RagB/SusD family nutrient uptake outer membrane protein [Puia sp.]|nr:RagB/SusD family nutrient uptake outer membrane protein [Puia sp.]
MQSAINKIFVFLGLAIVSASCNKQLNILPTTQEVDGNIISDLQGATTALNGVYYRFAASSPDNNGVPSTQWVDVNEGFPSELAGSYDYPYGGVDLNTHTYKPPSYELATMWSYGYNLVNAANGFLKNIAPVKNLGDSTRSEMMAEAKFLRAFGNTYLLLYFAQYYDTTSQYGIILRNEFVTTSNLNLPRSPVGQCYDSILDDLHFAEANLPSLNTDNTGANKWTAELLEARLLINRQTPADYANVIRLTNDIITNSPFTLEANTKDIFHSKGLSSNEVMLGIQPYTSPAQTYKWSQYLHYNDYILSDSGAAAFQGDPRQTWTYYMFTSPYGYGSFPAPIKYYPGDTLNIAPSIQDEYSYAFRLTEAYLLEAEAISASGGDPATARALLETVEGHAGITDFAAVDAASGPDLTLLIIREEMKNFIGEAGQDWYAVRRLPFATVQQLIPTLVSKDLLILPIPQTEMQTNGQMKQNPSY